MSTTKGPGLFRNLWYKWKALNLPWRKQFLVGADLSGNTFWEFKDALNANRLRRIVKYSRKIHHGDVMISPQWHQWLRHTRFEAPTIQEQQYEVSRQAMMKQLAADADERWREKPSYLDAPNKQQPAPSMNIEDSAIRTEDPPDTAKSAVGDQQEVAAASKAKTRERKEDPWQKAQQGAPGQNWQPAAWTPGVAQRRS